MTFTPYQGGIPTLYTRHSPRQRGGGFFSTLKRFLMPIAKTALPHVAGAVSDLIGGKAPIETLKARGRALGGDVAKQAADFIRGDAGTVKKPIKRKKQPAKSSLSKKKKRWS